MKPVKYRIYLRHSMAWNARLHKFVRPDDSTMPGDANMPLEMAHGEWERVIDLITSGILHDPDGKPYGLRDLRVEIQLYMHGHFPGLRYKHLDVAINPF